MTILKSFVLKFVYRALYSAYTNFEKTRATIPGDRSNYPIPKAWRHIDPGTVVMIYKGLMGKRILALRLRSSLIFFASPPRFHSSLGNDHLIIRNKTNTHVQTTNTKHKQRAPYAQRSPQKKKAIPLQPRSKAVVSLLSLRSQIVCSLSCLSPCLRVCGSPSGKWCLVLQAVLYFCCRVEFLQGFQRGKKCFPPSSSPRQRANSRRQWLVLSPRSEDTAVRVFQDPYWTTVV